MLSLLKRYMTKSTIDSNVCYEASLQDDLIVITPAKLIKSDKEIIHDLIDRGDIESLLKAKKMITNIINNTLSL